MQHRSSVWTTSQPAVAGSPCLSAGLTLHSSGICGNHLVVGTQTGDCLFLDISRGGLAVSSFPAHRQGRVCSDASHAWHSEEAGPSPVLSPWPPHQMSVLLGPAQAICFQARQSMPPCLQPCAAMAD